MLIDHNNEETLPLVLDTGCWAGHSIYPNTKMDEARMVALVKQYGAERILINSAADWGVSDPLKVPKTVARDARGGHRRGDIRRIVWHNPVAFFAPERPARPAGSTAAASISASSSKATRCCAARRRWCAAHEHGPPHARPQRRRADARAARRAHPAAARARRAGRRAAARTVTPAVTCSVQSTFLTGTLPREHGIVGNGWYFRDLAEVWLWRQSNQLVAGEKIWEAAKRRDPTFTCAKLFWWYNMYSTADLAVTPRPMYPADGRKLPDVYTQPAELRDELQAKLGTFPLFNFWGPTADIASSRWIADCALHVYDTQQPTLTLVYLPHLDYRCSSSARTIPTHSPRIRASRRRLRRADRARARADGARVIVLSEYGITAVTGAVHLNRALREAGLLRVREELGRELLDAGASRGLRRRGSPGRARLRAARPSASPRCAACSKRCPASSACSATRASAQAASITRARASWSRSARRTAGSRTTTGSTTRARPTSRAPSRSTASPATTRSSCSSIRR